jgi:chemotaxis protein MotB
MKFSKLFVALFTVGMLASCVSKKKFNESQASLDQCQEQLTKAQSMLDDCEESKEKMKMQLDDAKSDLNMAQEKVGQLEDDLAYMKKTNTNLLDRLGDMSVVNKEGAESIRKSLEAINEQSDYIKQLNTKVQVRDSMNMALVMKLRRSLSDVADEDVNVKVDKGVVYISLSDQMLFNTASAVVSSRANEVLSKVANILNDHKDLEILVEGHTDDVPIKTDCVKDNWDLSVKRATSVVRKLTGQYDVDPSRLTAGGRGEYDPIATNDSSDGRQKNRRTEIIIVPKLDQFFQLASPEGTK